MSIFSCFSFIVHHFSARFAIFCSCFLRMAIWICVHFVRNVLFAFFVAEFFFHTIWCKRIEIALCTAVWLNRTIFAINVFISIRKLNLLNVEIKMTLKRVQYVYWTWLVLSGGIECGRKRISTEASKSNDAVSSSNAYISCVRSECGPVRLMVKMEWHILNIKSSSCANWSKLFVFTSVERAHSIDDRYTQREGSISKELFVSDMRGARHQPQIFNQMLEVTAPK